MNKIFTTDLNENEQVIEKFKEEYDRNLILCKFIFRNKKMEMSDRTTYIPFRSIGEIEFNVRRKDWYTPFKLKRLLMDELKTQFRKVILKDSK